MNAKVLIEYTIKDVCNPDDFGKGQKFKTFPALVKELIKSEGIHGIAQDKFKVLDIRFF